MPSLHTLQAQLQQLKKSIQAEVHRTTGRKPPLLSNNVNFEDPISFEELSPNNAWYIVPNTVNGNKIRHLYSKQTLDQILETSKKSPFTRAPIQKKNVRKYMNFKKRASAASAAAATGSVSTGTRPRHGLFSSPVVQSQIRKMMISEPAGMLYKIYVLLPSQSVNNRVKKHFTLCKIPANANGGNKYIFSVPGGSTLTASAATFTQKLQEILHSFPAHSYYVGYRRESSS